ncbi:MAG TPA: carboxypeptidase regulatory-like domain-containing protein [Firmicutes bacterium]|nr:carboxypeptidase regulatory-like domain-containing protein [Bacillota bacterium]
MKRMIWATGIIFAAACLVGGCASLTRREGERVAAGTPAVLAARSEGGGRVAVLWRASKEPAGIVEYRLYRRKAGEAFTLWKRFDASDVGPEVQSTAMVGAASGEVYYFRMTSVLTGGQALETAPSTILGVRVQDSANEILVVDDGPRGRSFDRTERVVALYGDSLDQLRRSFDSCLSEAVLSGDIALADYSCVLWTCGAEGREPLTAEEQALLRAYLDQEGDLFICGSGMGPALAGRDAKPQSREFYQNYLKAYSEEDWRSLPARLEIEGDPDSPVWEKVKIRFDGAEEPSEGKRSPVRSPCRLEPYGGSEAVLYYAGVSGASAAAVAYVGNFATPNAFSRMVYLGVAWEELSPGEQRTELLKAVLRYLTKAGPLKPIGGVKGTVTDATTGRGLEAIEIRLLGGTNYLGVPVRTFTKEDGTFSLVALEGTYHLAAGAPGYRRAVVHNVHVRSQRPFEVSVALEPMSKR